jgi:hypothetical protein
VKQLFDLVPVVVFELEPRPLDALLERKRLLGNEILLDVKQLLVVLPAVLEGGLDEVGLGEVEVDVRRRVDEEGVEAFSRPLDITGREAT